MTTINTPTSWDDELKSRLDGLTNEQKDKLLEMLQQDKKERIKWNKDAILKDLKKNYVKIEENAEMMWYTWKIVHINLPAIWNFKWFKFDYFVSNDPVDESTFEKGPKNESYSKKEILNSLQKFGEYMSEYKIKTNITKVNRNDYDLRDYWKYVTDLLWLTEIYWLSDEHHGKPEECQTRYNAWFCNAGTCTIHSWISTQRLLLKVI